MLEKLTAADFRPRVDDPFRLVPLVDGGGEPVDAVLTEVVEHGAAPGDGHRAPFSVFFSAPAATTAAQGIFSVEGNGLDALELFLVPVLQDAAGEGVLYEAVFG